MREYKLYFTSLLLALFAISCQRDTTPVFDMQQPTSPAIELCIAGGVLGADTRAEDMADTDWERAITHLDVMIFNDAATDEHKSLFYHERVTTATPEGRVRLGVDIKQIQVGAKYWVYVVANSTSDATIFGEQIGNVKELCALTEQTHNLHLTATAMHETASHFLMDGVAYKGSAEPAKAEAITIAEAEITDVVTLNVKLRRAAAKIVVKLMTNDKIRFANDIDGATPGYYMRNTPYETLIVNNGVVRQSEQLETTIETMSPYYKWLRDGADNIIGTEITTYVYSHSWNTSDSFAYATNLLVDIPTYYTTELNGVATTTPHPNNYYQVPLTKEFRFERNHYYEVTAFVHAPGAEDFSEPVEITDLKYSVWPWSERNIDIGGEHGPEYLKVNLDELKIFNTKTDATSLRFASSSPVTITIEDCYYIDKFGIQQSLSPANYNMSGTTPSGSISGNITVNSDIPTNNTIRYFTLKVVNETGQVEYVTVEQYPLVYVVNILGHYSYRDDFKSGNEAPTTIYNQGSRYVGISLNEWDSNTGTWSYNYHTSVEGFWSSKVVRSTYESTDTQSRRGRSNIDYYRWVRESYGSNNYELSYSNAEDPGNARMYHVRITATSGDYNLGVPRLTTDQYVSFEFTDPGADNANLVSPSFMIASRLGFVNSSGLSSANDDTKRISLARDHCANYVEVANNGMIYDDWRLPTASELKIIIELQGTSNQSADAIDYLLNADYYLAASGRVFNSKNSNNRNESQARASSWAIRCIRDAY